MARPLPNPRQLVAQSRWSTLAIAAAVFAFVFWIVFAVSGFVTGNLFEGPPSPIQWAGLIFVVLIAFAVAKSIFFAALER